MSDIGYLPLRAELVIRLDGRRLGSGLAWVLSSAAGVAVLVGLYWVFFRR